MKTLLTAMSILFCVGLSAQTEVNFLNALGKGDYSNLDEYLSSEVTLSINDSQKTISKSAAVKELKTFLGSKKIVKFKILHNGKSSDSSSSYRVARLKTDRGTYRVFAYSESENSRSSIIEIRVDSM